MHIVTLGSGTGQATLLRGLREHDCQVTAVVGVTDNGGHSGRLRRLLHLPQVGDTRQCLGALFDDQSVWGQLLRYRFTEGELRGISVGNLMLAALSRLHGDLGTAVEEIRRATGLRQRILPISDADTHISAELQDGRQVVGEWQIIHRRPQSPIVRLFLQPPAMARDAVLVAIAQADMLILCPGSLLTGTIAVLLHEGIREALAASNAFCLYVCNLMTQAGQTDGYTAKQHLALLHRYLGRQVDTVIVHHGTLPAPLQALYAQHGSYPVVNDLTPSEVAVYLADVVEHPDSSTLRDYMRPAGAGMQVGLHLIRHDAHKLAAHLMAIASSL